VKRFAATADTPSVSSTTLRALVACCLTILAGSASARAEEWPAPPQPTVRYASLEAARDSISAIVFRTFDRSDTTLQITREPATFEYLYVKATARGWAFHITVRDTVCPIVDVEKGLTDAGWAETFGYSADGPDGSTMGYRSKNFFCLVEGTWDGGDDTDDTYVPKPGCTVTLTCVPRREDDVPR
jgi:hypothetical protein